MMSGKQRGVYFRFKLLKMLADRGLRNMQFFGRSHIAFF
jgi:hypothetical protein